MNNILGSLRITSTAMEALNFQLEKIDNLLQIKEGEKIRQGNKMELSFNIKISVLLTDVSVRIKGWKIFGDLNSGFTKLSNYFPTPANRNLVKDFKIVNLFIGEVTRIYISRRIKLKDRNVVIKL